MLTKKSLTVLRLVAFFPAVCALAFLNPDAVLAQAEKALKTENDKISYSIGLSIGQRMKAQGVNVDPTMVAQGLRDGLKGNKPKLTNQEMSAVMQAFQKKQQARQAEMQQAAGSKNRKEGEMFLLGNKKNKGVVTTASGLQYQIMKTGKGKTPKATDTISAHYRGTLIDGKEFDSSYKRGQPATFPVNGVIKGWQEALQLMTVGSKWKIWVPSDLGYGSRGAGAMIGPDATLIFEIELLEIK